MGALGAATSSPPASVEAFGHMWSRVTIGFMMLLATQLRRGINNASRREISTRQHTTRSKRAARESDFVFAGLYVVGSNPYSFARTCCSESVSSCGPVTVRAPEEQRSSRHPLAPGRKGRNVMSAVPMVAEIAVPCDTYPHLAVWCIHSPQCAHQTGISQISRQSDVLSGDPGRHVAGKARSL